MDTKILKFEIHGDDRGNLIALESNLNIPFDIRRVYYMYGTTEGTRRGYHAHRCLKQVLICTKGSCTIHLDDGSEQAEVLLDDPSTGLYLGSCVWREMYSFSEDAVLMVLASELYDEADYIRDYDEFIEYIKGLQ